MGRKEKEGQKSKKRWGFCKCCYSFPSESPEDDGPLVLASKPPLVEEVKLRESEQEQSKHAAELASTRSSDGLGEEIAAIMIQAAFRGYLARRALQALRGFVRLKSLVHSTAAKRQTTNALQYMQTLARIQSQIRSRRTRMREENQALQRQLQLKQERGLEKKIGEEWDDSLKSKEQIEANRVSKQEAAIRRERALAYAFSHQSKNSVRSAIPTFMDPDNPQWGWSWLDRWMEARPWEIGTPPASQKSSRPPSRQSSSTHPSRPSSVIGRPAKQSSPKVGWTPPEDDSRSTVSLQSIRDEVASLKSSSPTIPNYMATTHSAMARSRLPSPTCEKLANPKTAQKRLSFSMTDKRNVVASGARRHSDPPKVDTASLHE